MRNLVLAMTALVVLTSGHPSTAQGRLQNRQCLHDQLETRTERVRRERALSVADAITRAQAAARRFGARRYLPLAELFNVPEVPEGFRVQLYTDDSTYAFSIKDSRDPCGYAVFSDQSMDVYEAIPTPRGGTQLLTQR
jgi:hypothetical protein